MLERGGRAPMDVARELVERDDEREARARQRFPLRQTTFARFLDYRRKSSCDEPVRLAARAEPESHALHRSFRIGQRVGEPEIENVFRRQRWLSGLRARLLTRLQVGAIRGPRSARAAFDAALHRAAFDDPAVFGVSGDETDLLAAQPPLGDRDLLAARRERPGERLEFLLERQLPLRQAPRVLRPWRARYKGAPCTSFRTRRRTGRSRPLPSRRCRSRSTTMRVPGFKSRNFGVSLSRFSGSRNSASTSPGRCRLRTCRPGRTALCRRRLPSLRPLRQLDHVRVVLDAERPRAALGGSDDVAAVARAEIDDEVLRRHFRHVEHLLDQRRSGVGTHTTSLPSWPTVGSKGLSAACAPRLRQRRRKKRRARIEKRAIPSRLFSR